MKNYQLPILKFFKFSLLFAFFLVLQSCSKEDSLPTNSDYQGKSIEQSINIVLTKLKDNSNLIEKELNKNPKFVLAQEVKNSLSKAKSIDNVANILEKEGFQNSQYFATLIDTKIQILKAFQQSNPDFYKLNLQARTQLANQGIEALNKTNNNVFNKTASTNKTTEGETNSCLLVLKSDLKACNQSYSNCVNLALVQYILGYETFGITLLTALATDYYCKREQEGCQGHAYEIYNICIIP